MKRNIYVKLMDEHTNVFRPVAAVVVKDNLYKIEGFEICDRGCIYQLNPGVFSFYVLRVVQDDTGAEFTRLECTEWKLSEKIPILLVKTGL